MKKKMSRVSLEGKVFGRLSVIRFLRMENRLSVYECICSCNVERKIERNWNQLKRGKYPSCGCWGKEVCHDYWMNKQRKENKYDICEDFVIGYVGEKQFIIDKEDYDLVKKYSWHIDPKGYLMSKIMCKNTYIQRLITNCPDNMIVDHIDLNPLNNRRKNLRVVTYRQNQQNKRKKGNTSSVYIGVSKRKDSGKWRAQIYDNDGKSIWLGAFLTEEEAALAYNKKAEELGYLTRNKIDESKRKNE